MSVRIGMQCPFCRSGSMHYTGVSSNGLHYHTCDTCPGGQHYDTQYPKQASLVFVGKEYEEMAAPARQSGS